MMKRNVFHFVRFLCNDFSYISGIMQHQSINIIPMFRLMLGFGKDKKQSFVHVIWGNKIVRFFKNFVVAQVI